VAIVSLQNPYETLIRIPWQVQGIKPKRAAQGIQPPAKRIQRNQHIRRLEIFQRPDDHGQPGSKPGPARSPMLPAPEQNPILCYPCMPFCKTFCKQKTFTARYPAKIPTFTIFLSTILNLLGKVDCTRPVHFRFDK
jgi:hypothetical protein